MNTDFLQVPASYFYSALLSAHTKSAVCPHESPRTEWRRLSSVRHRGRLEPGTRSETVITSTKELLGGASSISRWHNTTWKTRVGLHPSKPSPFTHQWRSTGSGERLCWKDDENTCSQDLRQSTEVTWVYSSLGFIYYRRMDGRRNLQWVYQTVTACCLDAGLSLRVGSGGTVCWENALQAGRSGGSIPDGVNGFFFYCLNSSGRTRALGWTHPLTEMNTRLSSLESKTADT